MSDVKRFNPCGASTFSPPMRESPNGAYVQISDYEHLRDQLTTKDRQIAELKRGIEMAIDHIDGSGDRFSVREGTPLLYQLRKILEETE